MQRPVCARGGSNAEFYEVTKNWARKKPLNYPVHQWFRKLGTQEAAQLPSSSVIQKTGHARGRSTTEFY